MLPCVIHEQHRDVTEAFMGVSPDDSLGDRDSIFSSDSLKQEFLCDRHLDLSGGALDAAAAASLIASLEADCPTANADQYHFPLEALSLSRTTIGRHLVASLLAALATRANALHSLDVSFCDLTDSSVGSLATWVPASLTSLSLAGNRLSDRGVAALLAALQASSASMVHLDLSGNAVGLRSAALLGELIGTQWAPSLRTLTLSGCGLDEEAGQVLLSGCQHCGSLKALDLSANNCSLALSRVGKLPAHLRALNFSGNAVPLIGTRRLAAAVVSCQATLTELRLSGCLDGDDGLRGLFSVARAIPELRVLDLSRCSLTYRSGKMLSQTLASFLQLERVSVSGNTLGAEGISELCGAIARMRSLRSVRMSGCSASNCGAALLLGSVLRSPSPIEEVVLSGNGLTVVGLAHLDRLMLEHPGGCNLITQDPTPTE